MYVPSHEIEETANAIRNLFDALIERNFHPNLAQAFVEAWLKGYTD